MVRKVRLNSYFELIHYIVTSSKRLEIYAKHMPDVISVLTGQNLHIPCWCRHLVKDVHTGPRPISCDCAYPVNHTSHFTFRPVSVRDVTNAPQITDPRKSTGADQLDPFLLKLSTPFIAKQTMHTFHFPNLNGYNSKQGAKEGHIINFWGYSG